jgi:hypothetical protein
MTTQLPRFGMLVLVCLAFQTGTRAGKPFDIVIQRNLTCIDNATVGSLTIGGSEIARTLELPFKDNLENVSRVQAGTYDGFIRTDGTKGWRIELKNVPNRTNVQLHVGNYTKDTEGCVLLGLDVSTANTSTGTTCAVVKSKEAFSALQAAMQNASENGVSSQPLAIKVTLRD